MHKDIADVEGDGKNDKKTLPVVFGTRKAAFVVICLYIMGIMLYHGILLSSGFQLVLLFWGVDIIIFLGFIPILRLISLHNDIEYVHKTRKITMGIFLLIILSLIINFLIHS